MINRSLKGDAMRVLEKIAHFWAAVAVVGILYFAYSGAYRMLRTKDSPGESADPVAYRVLSIEKLSGSESSVSDGDIYRIVARGLHSTVHAEG